MFCNYCGKEIPDGSKFCRYCGKALKPIKLAEDVEAPPLTEVDESTTKTSDDIVQIKQEEVIQHVTDTHSDIADEAKDSDDKVQIKQEEAIQHIPDQDSVAFDNKDSSEQKVHLPAGSGFVSPNTKKGFPKVAIIAAIAVLLLAIVVVAFACGKGGLSDNKQTDDKNTKTASEESGETVYVYRHDEWSVYVASFLSDSTIKVEKWSRVIADDETPFEYEKDLETVTIDEDNTGGFYWLDEEQTAFFINLKDTDREGLEQAPSVPFTKTTNKTVSSTNYADSIYTYGYDKWNLYVASKLSDSVVKIERWYTAVADYDEYPFKYQADICVINIEDSSASDFEWIDEEETAFKLTLYDKSQKNLKNGSKQTFTIDDSFKDQFNLSSLELPDTSYSKGEYTKPKTAHKTIAEMKDKKKETDKKDKEEKNKESDKKEEDKDRDESDISPEFKEMMDSYEAFFDEYVEFMKKYQNSNDTAGMLTDYAEYMTKYTDYMQKLEALDEDDMTVAEAAYYTEVNARIMKKLAEIS